MITRNTYGEIEVGDSIATHFSGDVPSSATANGRHWSGTVRSVVALDGDRVRIEVVLDGRTLCSDDLVYGFGGTKDGSREVVHSLVRGAGEYVHQRVRDFRSGRRYWTGVDAVAVAPVAEAF